MQNGSADSKEAAKHFLTILLLSQHIIAGRDSEIAPTEALDSEYLS